MADKPLRPAFYAKGRGIAGDCWVLLHPPYTLWHLSYVVIGGSLSSTFEVGRLIATLSAFFLAVGVGSHALDELQGRPLNTGFSDRVLVITGVTGLLGAIGFGILGVVIVGLGVIPFIAVGTWLAATYSLEWVGGRFHTDVAFALAWGSFPLLTSYYAQAETIRAPALLVAAAAFGFSYVQRVLSTRARFLRRRVVAARGRLDLADGTSQEFAVNWMLRPLELSLRVLAWSLIATALGLLTLRIS